MTRSRARLALFIAVVLLWAAGCSSNSPSKLTTPMSQPSSSSAPVATAFGAPTTAVSPDGTATVSVATPHVVAFHAAIFDKTCKVKPSSCSKPGTDADPYVVAKVSWVGVSGSVNIDTTYEYMYEAPDGTLVDEAEPLATFEGFDPLTNHAATITAGQKTHGSIAFHTDAPGGKVLVQEDGSTVATYTAPAS